MSSAEGRSRVVIEGVRPEIDCGRFAVKRTVGENIRVEADVFGDSHDVLSAMLLYRRGADGWNEVPMEPLVNDRWRGEFRVTDVGKYVYTIAGWVDRFLTWHRDFKKRVAAAQKVGMDLEIGARLVEAAVERAAGDDARRLSAWVRRLRDPEAARHVEQICEEAELPELMRRYASRDFATTYGRELQVQVDRERARFSAWYELFPRSAAEEPGRHGTLRDVEARLPYVAGMGFDVLYLPPVHPVGLAHRKGKNNAVEAQPDDVGSPWAIGGKEGGHKAIHPDLGTFEDFERLVSAARRHGIEIALDVAFQCSPDHPYVREHPEWFRSRPDGTIQYAENPPKKYQDIYPFDFETDNWRELWEELQSVFLFWIGHGVRIFRVDNPHTKPFGFWQWCIGEIKDKHPDVLFLSEAFTRPKIMYQLAKLGFTQSYTYFAWRNTKAELTEYLTEVTQTEVADFFRPNLWPNTPDILPEMLQVGGRAAFMMRFVLAATLGASYGIYGPPFEHCWSQPREPGSEEYLNSEKYQIHHHNLARPDSLKDFIARVNRIRREHAALKSDHSLRFHPIDNDQLLCYSKRSDDGGEVLIVIVNLDPHHTQSGWVELPLKEFGVPAERAYQMHDLLGGGRFLWNGPKNFVQLDPHVVPAHIFRLRKQVRSERDFEYFL
ncbi:MAG: alpha-1,4-glucan--maltose-1-phosphate maltosyltransferase [Planctomycetes bacterium]|nr:alpha-1,4-glucan--maltose-1-phosphate maltosyltransferase [Planctomycetota bacterium]